MPLILLDGCEDLSSCSAFGTPTIVPGRYGNGIMQIGSGRTFTYTIPAALESDTITLGYAVNFDALPNGGIILTLSSDSGAVDHLTLRTGTPGIQPAGSLRVVRNVTELCISAPVIVANTWMYLELQAKLHDTTGFVTLRLNGSVIASATNVDTKNAGTKTTFDTITFNNGSIGAVEVFDDIYIMSGAGDSFLATDYRGITVETIYPDGNGSANQWVGSDADSVNNYLLVNEVPPVTTTYTKSSTVGQLDQYTLANLNHTDGTIVAVCHQATMGLAAAGSQTFQIVNRRGGDAVSPTMTAVSTTYAGFHHVLTTDPETAAPFTITNVNNLQTGVKVV